jgi:hypothetical protein
MELSHSKLTYADHSLEEDSLVGRNSFLNASNHGNEDDDRKQQPSLVNEFNINQSQQHPSNVQIPKQQINRLLISTDVSHWSRDALKHFENEMRNIASNPSREFKKRPIFLSPEKKKKFKIESKDSEVSASRRSSSWSNNRKQPVSRQNFPQTENVLDEGKMDSFDLFSSLFDNDDELLQVEEAALG